MSSFFGAGLAWLETDETPAATATAAMQRDDGETAKQSAHRASFGSDASSRGSGRWRPRPGRLYRR